MTKQQLITKLNKKLEQISTKLDKLGKSFLNDLNLQSVESNINQNVLEPYSQMLLNIYKCWSVEQIKTKFMFQQATCFHFKLLDDLHKQFIQTSTDYQHKSVKALQATEESDIKKAFIKAWNAEYSSIPKALNQHKLPLEVENLMKEFWKITA